MPVPVLRLVLGLLLGGALLADGATPAPVAAQSCDPAYISHCVPPVWEVGDLKCDYFYAQGIYGIVLADPYNDPHGLDGWNYVDDGYGCEGEYEEETTELAGTQGVVASGAECDPSYPDLCIPPGSADLNCDHVYGLGMSHITVYPPDPHGFDGNFDGVGCESG